MKPDTASQRPATIRLEPPSPTNVLIYEYGARVDRECEKLFHDQAFQAHALYNEIVGYMQEVVRDAQATLLAVAGDRARELDREVATLDEAFKAARSANDEAAMKEVASHRRTARKELWSLLAAAKKVAKEDLKPIYARVGKNSSCGTYTLRSKAVANGLGWATANAILDNALDAWKKTITKGQAPRFARFAEKTQLTLTLQFTTAGGIAANHLLAGRHQEFVLDPKGPAGRRQYGDFLFRAGAAKAQTYIRGTWQYHRPLPEGSSVGLVRLVGRKHGPRWKYAIQLMVKEQDPIHVPLDREKADDLVAIHLGWAASDDGRRIAGVAYGPDPGLAQLIRLPNDIERDLGYSRDLASRRDQARNEIVPVLKALDTFGLPEEFAAELEALRRTRTEHVTPRRLHSLLRKHEGDAYAAAWVNLLKPWAEVDRKLHIAEDGIAKRARNRRWNTYQEHALTLVRGAKMVALSHVDLKTAAQKIDEDTGERSEFTAAARRGRTDASVSELVAAIKWLCNKTATPLLLVEGEETAAVCPYCAGKLSPNADDWQLSDCSDCGAQVDRKLGAAARIYQLTVPWRQEFEQEFHELQAATWATLVADQAERKAKMAEGRRSANAKRTAESGEDRTA